MTDPVDRRGFLKLPAMILFASQLLAGMALFAAVWLTGHQPPVPVLLAAQALLAAVLAVAFGLSPWWGGVQIALPFAAYYSQFLQAPAWIWLIMFALAFLVYRNSFRSGVPLYLSNRKTWAALVDLIPQAEGVRVIDLGGGLGGTALYLARHRPKARILSVESAPIPALISGLRRSLSGLANLQTRYEDFWEEDLGRYHVVYAFLSPVPMERLYGKVRAEMKPGGLFISNSFAVPGVEADEVLELNDRRRTRLMVWRVS